MASRYRLSIERPINRSTPKPQSEEVHLVNYELTPEPHDAVDISNDTEFLHARLRSKAQIECQLRKKLSDAHANTTLWRNRYQCQADRANHFRDEVSSLRKRHSDEVAELNRELRWNRKKIKALERVIEESHQAQSPRTEDLIESSKRMVRANEMLLQENLRLSEKILHLTLSQEDHAKQHEQLINELEKIKQSREEDLINIQNLENAVKALHDENVILKETPIPVVLPQSQLRQRDIGHNMYQYSSLRPTRACVSLIDQRAQEKRRSIVTRANTREIPSITAQERWPYASSDEDSSAIR